MAKFRVGQIVKCIDPINPRDNGENGGGGGWKEGRRFKIGRITNTGDDRVPIVWPFDERTGIVTAGVWEDYVELVSTEWDEETN